MVELLISMVILIVGMAAILGLIITAISNNSRTKQDTGGTLAAQMVLETIAAQPAAATVNITDCTNTAKPIATAAAASPGAGASLNAAGGIDFLGQDYASAPANYKMQYTSCGTASTRITYDVRWNITTINAFSKLVTVSARPARAEIVGNNATGNRLFQQPVTLKTIAVTGN
jgi:Tfp pilus assembly protein PilV